MRVGDFGLAEDIYIQGYFRQNKYDAVKLPFKWMAPESLRDGLFNEKSDVVSLHDRDLLTAITHTHTHNFIDSGHLVSHAGKYSVVVGSPTLQWML